LKSEIELSRSAALEAETYAKALQNVLADLRAESDKKRKPFGRTTT